MFLCSWPLQWQRPWQPVSPLLNGSTVPYQTGPELTTNQVTITKANGEKVTMDVSNGGLLVTNVANTLDYSGELDVPTSDKTNVVYHAAVATDSTSALLGKFGNTDEATSAIEAQIAANKAATVERLNSQKDETVC